MSDDIAPSGTAAAWEVVRKIADQIDYRPDLGSLHDRVVTYSENLPPERMTGARAAFAVRQRVVKAVEAMAAQVPHAEGCQRGEPQVTWSVVARLWVGDAPETARAYPARMTWRPGEQGPGDALFVTCEASVRLTWPHAGGPGRAR